MTIREQVIQILGDRKTTDLAKLVNRKVRGLSERKLYDFIHYGKSLNSDALDALFKLLELEVVSTRERMEREQKLKLAERRADAKHLEERSVARTVDAKFYLLFKAGWWNSKRTRTEQFHEWETRVRRDLTAEARAMSPEERSEAVQKCKLANTASQPHRQVRRAAGQTTS